MALTIAATSALVLRWAGPESYPHPLVRRYFAALDLSACAELCATCDRIYPHWDAFLRNRKFSIQAILRRRLRRASAMQLVSLGAGLDPLTFECAARFPRLRTFDVDANTVSLR